MTHTPAEPTTAQIHAMCSYLRSCDMAHVCLKCPASEQTPYGKGQRGCYVIAEETIVKAWNLRRATERDSNLLAALEAGADALLYLVRRGPSGRPIGEADERGLAHAATLRRHAEGVKT